MSLRPNRVAVLPAVALAVSVLVGVAVAGSSSHPAAAQGGGYSVTVDFDNPVASGVFTLTQIDSGAVSQQTYVMAPQTGTTSLTIDDLTPPTNALSVLDLSVVDTTGPSEPPADITSISDSSGNSWTMAVTTPAASGSQPVVAEQWYTAQEGQTKPIVAGAAGQVSSPGGQVDSSSVSTSAAASGSALGDVIIGDLGFLYGTVSDLPAFSNNSPQYSGAGGVYEQGGYLTGAQPGSYSYGGDLTTSDSDGWAATVVAFDPQQIFTVSGCSSDATKCINAAVKSAQAAYAGPIPPARYSESAPPGSPPQAGPEIVPNIVYIPAGTYDLNSAPGGHSIDIPSPTWSSTAGDFPDWGVPVEIVGAGDAGSATPTGLVENVRGAILMLVRASGTTVSDIDLDGDACSNAGGCAYDAFGTDANDVTLSNFTAEGDDQYIAVNFFGPHDSRDCSQINGLTTTEPSVNSSGQYVPANCNYGDVASNGSVVARPQIQAPAYNGAIVMALTTSGTMSDLNIVGDYFGFWRSFNVAAENISVGPLATGNYPTGFEAWQTGSSDVSIRGVTVNEGTYGLVGSGQIECMPDCEDGPAEGVTIDGETAPGGALLIGDVGSIGSPGAPGVTITNSTIGKIGINPVPVQQDPSPTGDQGKTPVTGTIDAATYQSLERVECNGFDVGSTGGISVEGDAGVDLCPGPASQLVFTVEPGGGTAGKSWAVQPVVMVEDAEGYLETSFHGRVVLGVEGGVGTPGPNLSGCSASTASGVATFSKCRIDQAGTGYQLTATDKKDNLTATSTPFSISPAAAARLAFVHDPEAVRSADETLVADVAVEDSYGNLVEGASHPVSLDLASGRAGAVLGCDPDPVLPVDGIASFSCDLREAGRGYVLQAKDDGLTGADSTTFTTTAGPAEQLIFIHGPPEAIFPQTSLQLRVAVEDAYRNVAGKSDAPVSLGLSGGPPGAGVTCPTTTVDASRGVAAFDCSVHTAGAGYVLEAQAGGLVSASSAQFDVTPGRPRLLVFSTEPPASTSLGTGFAVAVSVEDAFGNLASSSNAPVMLSLGGQTRGGEVNCASNPIDASAGIADFDCAVQPPGGDYQLTATTDGLVGVDSSTFAVTVPAGPLRLEPAGPGL